MSKTIILGENGKRIIKHLKERSAKLQADFDKKVASFHFEHITPEQQMKERNSAYKFFGK